MFDVFKMCIEFWKCFGVKTFDDIIISLLVSVKSVDVMCRSGTITQKRSSYHLHNALENSIVDTSLLRSVYSIHKSIISIDQSIF